MICAFKLSTLPPATQCILHVELSATEVTVSIDIGIGSHWFQDRIQGCKEGISAGVTYSCMEGRTLSQLSESGSSILAPQHGLAIPALGRQKNKRVLVLTG